MLQSSFNGAKHLIEQLSILLVTATDIETDELLKSLSPLPNQEQIVQVFVDNQTYYIGLLGVYGIVLVQSEMGAIGSSSSLVTSINAISLWQPKAIIMIGIAFGIDITNQSIGDILISSHIIPYESSKIKDSEITYRSELPSASSLLVNRARHVRDWHYEVNQKPVKVFVGPLLTGEKLIDSNAFKTQLTDYFKNAIGGEMESAGVYAAARNAGIDWIIIKAICDFADENKSVNKEINQRAAIRSVVNYSQKFLSNPYAFIDLGFKVINQNNEDEAQADKSPDIELVSLYAFLQPPASTNNNKAEDLKLKSYEIIQPHGNDNLLKEIEQLQILIPESILSLFQKRITACWNDYHEILASEGEYMDPQIDRFTNALMRCICRELKRVKQLNGFIPEQFLETWNTYGCATN